MIRRTMAVVVLGIWASVELVCAALPASAPIPAKESPAQRWLDGTEIIQKARQETGATADAVPFAPQAARLAPKRSLRTHAIGDTEPFWIVDFWRYFYDGTINMNEDKVQISAELKRITDHAYVYVEMGISFQDNLLDMMASEFENPIYARITDTFGHPPDALDGDPRVTILIADFPGAVSSGATVVGYFDDANQYTDAESIAMELGHSNEREMIYINKSAVTINPYTDELDTLALGIFAHEYQHLVHWGLDRNETIWFNEGCSEYAMYLCGYDETTQQHQEQFIWAPTFSLTEWQNEIMQYGAVYYFLRYIGGRLGGNDAISSLSQSLQHGTDALDTYLSAQHGTDFRTVFRNWTLATALCETSGDYSYPADSVYLPQTWRIMYDPLMIRPFFFTQRSDSFSTSETQTYLSMWTGEYYVFSRAGSQSGLPFQGYIDIDGHWRAELTYVGVDAHTVSSPIGGNALEYHRTHEFEVPIDETGRGAFNVPTDDDHFILILRNTSPQPDPTSNTIDMVYRLRVMPGSTTPTSTDTTAPDAVTDLAASALGTTGALLTFTATGDDGSSGAAYRYDLRFSDAPINTANFLAATPALPAPPAPAPAGARPRRRPGNARRNQPAPRRHRLPYAAYRRRSRQRSLVQHGNRPDRRRAGQHPNPDTNTLRIAHACGHAHADPNPDTPPHQYPLAHSHATIHHHSHANQ